MTKIRAAQNEAELLAGISETGIQNFPPGKPLVPTATDKEQILSQLSTEVSRLQYQSQKNSNNLMQGLILKWLRDGAIACLYGFGFRSLGNKSDVVNNTSVSVHTKSSRRR
jgi:flagellar hook-basal body complex protein FliE